MLQRSILIISLLNIMASSCIHLKDTVVDEDKFLGKKENKSQIYSSGGDGTFLNPFNINTNNWELGNIERLMLVEFKPLKGYRSVELQVIDNKGEKGGLVILYSAGKEQADVYHTPNLKLSKEMYANTLNNAVLTSTNMNYELKEVDGLLKTHLDFIDRFGNKIKMKVDESDAEMKPCGLLAPIGGMAKNPEFMTIVFMKHFRFLSQTEKNIKVLINNKEAELLKLPLKINGIKGYQTKYSMKPVTVSWNKNTNEKLSPLTPENKQIKGENFEIILTNNNKHFEIESFTGIQKKHKIKFKFSPAIPDLKCLAEGVGKIGKFSLAVDEIKGIMAGVYAVEKKNGKVILTVQPTKGYSPVPGKAWMKKMKWEAEITQKEGAYFISSKWVK